MPAVRQSAASSKLIVGRSVFPLNVLLHEGGRVLGRIGEWDATIDAPREAEGLIHVRRVARLRLPTGRLVASDPFVGPPPSAPPFANRFDPGSYEVWVTEVEGLRPSEPVTAAAFLRVGRGVPVRWTYAKTVVSRRFPKDSLPGFGVDIATAAYYDYGAADGFRRTVEAAGNFDAVIATTDGSLVIDKKTKANIVVFPSGHGDGAYTSWLGLDRDGRVLVLLTDFEVLASIESTYCWETMRAP